MKELRPEDRLRRRPGVLFRELGGETVLLDPVRGTYFAANDTGTVIWRLLDPTATLAEMHRAVVETFDVAADTAWDDVASFVRALIDHGLADLA